MLQKDYNTVEEAVKDFEKEMGIRQGFLESLLKEDDWSFVIKAHAFFESAFVHLLVALTEKRELEDIFSYLELSNAKTGKLAFAISLGILNEDEIRFVRKFSELRNLLVHNVKQVDFDLKAHVNNFNKNQLGSFVKTYSYFAGGENFKYTDKIYNTANFVRSDPKRAIWFCVMIFAGVLYLKRDTALQRSMIDFIQKQVVFISRQKQGSNMPSDLNVG
jgi:hypothetical protein